jgi:predicted ATPase
VLDQLCWLERTGRVLPPGPEPRYHGVMFLFAPWPAVNAPDPDRNSDPAIILAEYQALTRQLPERGYDLHLVPQGAAADRADWILACLGLPASPA